MIAELQDRGRSPATIDGDSMPDQSSAATEHAILQEIIAPLDLLPDDPMELVEADFPAALRGYDRLAVDEYVRETRALVAELYASRSPEAAVRRALERVGEEVAGILQRAHETAERITAQSRSEAEDRLELARAEAEQIVHDATRSVRELDRDTDRIWGERRRIVTDAQDLAAELLELATVAERRFAGAAQPEPEPDPVATQPHAVVFEPDPMATQPHPVVDEPPPSRGHVIPPASQAASSRLYSD
jgi:cell division septum initiation protein DivIVA